MKLNRKIFVLLLCAVCLTVLASCGKREQTETEWSEAQMAQAIWNSQPDLDSWPLLYGDPIFDGYLADTYHIDPASLAGGAVLYAGGVYAQEIAVLRLNAGADVHAAADALEDYIFAREGAFAGYAPEQYAVLEQSAAAERGQYAVLLICPDQDAANEAFAACFTMPPPQIPIMHDPNDVAITPEPVPELAPEPDPQPAPEAEPDTGPELEQPSDPDTESGPESDPQPDPESVPEPAPATEPESAAEWAYDASRIQAAWSSGGREGLYPEDLAILSILDEIPALTDTSMSDYDRELVLHDWMLDWAEYDPGTLSSGPIGDPIPHNDNPYGFLTGHKGICLGYSTTFQLFMDLIGIECVTVHGTAHGGTDEHAWNLVKLDGEWYAVDVTWDDPVVTVPIAIPRSTAHRYFNVTSDFLRANDHQWDSASAPEANGTAFAWDG